MDEADQAAGHNLMENDDEEDEMDPDVTHSEEDEEAHLIPSASTTLNGRTEEDGEIELMRRIILHHGGEHGAASDGEGPDPRQEHQADPYNEIEDDEESFDKEVESPGHR